MTSLLCSQRINWWKPQQAKVPIELLVTSDLPSSFLMCKFPVVWEKVLKCLLSNMFPPETEITPQLNIIIIIMVLLKNYRKTLIRWFLVRLHTITFTLFRWWVYYGPVSTLVNAEEQSGAFQNNGWDGERLRTTETDVLVRTNWLFDT